MNQINNDVIRGYFILTLKNLNYSNKRIEQILDELYYVLDENSEEYAERTYNEWSER